ncbi:DUF2783 domain-containing protein [Alphaproteobacteria bacterium KMM 3653]|uniref:DUF2783 domain-containing protein n=1 Tax=Harenicola maris TaxID=2841044 RepID=A0AAP2CV30_9RHOB|nr:DUF2783 domain-containing protein [Harenicola maris]
MLSQLQTAPNFEKADDFYAALLAAHEGLDEAQMHALNARLILVLANHIGDQAVLEAAITVAKGASTTRQM